MSAARSHIDTDLYSLSDRVKGTGPAVQNSFASRSILAGAAQGPVISTHEALSFWGGVDPATGRVIDAHHPLDGVSIAGAILLMPTSRGSCSGSGDRKSTLLNSSHMSISY